MIGERLPPEAMRACRHAIERSLLPMAATEGQAHVVRLANAAFCGLIGRTSNDLIGRPFVEVVPEEARQVSSSVLDRVHRTGEPAAIERVSPQARGKAAYWTYTAWPVLGADERPVGVMIQATDGTEAALLQQQSQKVNDDLRQVSEQLLLSSIRTDELAEQAAITEEQLIQAKKMEGIGRLAAGIAHDFNNLLTALLGYADLAQESLPAGAEARPYLDGIRKAARRATTLTGQLLSFARKQIIDPKVADLNALIVDVRDMLQHVIAPPVEIVFVPGRNLGSVLVDSGQFGQVLMNLVVNARDAMPGGGRITIATANVTLDEVAARRQGGLPPGDYVRLTVSDTGTGMTEDVASHAFEPFFTTKGQGSGTGLGLATCYGIVKQVGGDIRVASAPGEGTIVTIDLPRVEYDPFPTPPPVPSPSLRGTEVVFVVDDEPLVRDIGAQVLRRQGYTVFEASNGEEALHLIRECPRMIDLLVTDVLMPRMGGKALADRLAVTHPHLPVLFTSGYTEDAIVRDGVLQPGLAFLQKPFAPSALARKVRELLDAAGARKGPGNIVPPRPES